MRIMRTGRIFRATLPVQRVEVAPKTRYRVAVQPYVAFRFLELWTYSPGPDLLVNDIHVGNITLLANGYPIPAEAWDIVAVTRAVEVAIAGGWKAKPGERHPLYDRLLVSPETASPGMNINFHLENPTDRSLFFVASVHGLAIDADRYGAGYGDMIVHGYHGESAAPPVYRFDDLVPRRVPDTEPPPAPTAPPKIAPRPGPLTVMCRTCGAAPGAPCVATAKGKTHPARGLLPGECSGCPRKYWKQGLRATCNFCGKDRL